MLTYVRGWFPPNLWLWAVIAGLTFPAVSLGVYPPSLWKALFEGARPDLVDLALSTAFACLMAWTAGFVGCGLAEMYDLPFARTRPQGGPEADYGDPPPSPTS